MPTIKRTTIEFDKIRFYAYHGVMPQETHVGNIFEVTIRVDYPFSKAMLSDDLEDTLNYAMLYNVIKTEMDKPSKLLEHVVYRIINAISTTFPKILGGTIKLTKLTPPITGEMAGVSVEIEW
ncbi:MAG: dihydroneopterin aldolase [Muribaculaceae bacterium]